MQEYIVCFGDYISKFVNSNLTFPDRRDLNRERREHLEIMASMKVKPGVKSIIADARVGELYSIPI